MLDDVAACGRTTAALAAGDEELVSAGVANAIPDGESTVQAWCPHRDMWRGPLAEAAGISQAYLAHIATGKQTGTLGLYRSLADVLGIDLDGLVSCITALRTPTQRIAREAWSILG
jgi:hypothetical protein